MTEDDVDAELDRHPFVPLRVHFVSGKTMDVLAPNTAFPLSSCVLVLRSPALGKEAPDGYDLLAYRNIERIEQLQIGKRTGGKRKPA